MEIEVDNAGRVGVHRWMGVLRSGGSGSTYQQLVSGMIIWLSGRMPAMVKFPVLYVALGSLSTAAAVSLAIPVWRKLLDPMASFAMERVAAAV